MVLVAREVLEADPALVALAPADLVPVDSEVPVEVLAVLPKKK